MPEGPVFVGIDVAKAHLDIALRPTAEGWRVANDDAGIAPLVVRLQALRPALIVLEATGGLEVPVTAALTAAGLPVVVVNPRQARDFAKATGRMAKTDALDAHGLAHFAEAVRPAPRPLPDAQTQALSAQLARRRQLLDMLTAEKNRLGSAPRTIQADSQAHLTGRERRRAALNKDLGTVMRASPVWREPDDRRPSPPAWAQSSRRRWLPTARRGGPAAGSRSRPWWASPRATGIVAPCGANGPSGGGPGSGARRAVYEHPGGRAGPSGPPTRLCALAPCRTGPQSRLDRVYASGAHESEGHGQTAHAMATTLGPHS